jgi:hypothetical protein
MVNLPEPPVQEGTKGYRIFPTLTVQEPSTILYGGINLVVHIHAGANVVGDD